MAVEAGHGHKTARGLAAPLVVLLAICGAWAARHAEAWCGSGPGRRPPRAPRRAADEHAWLESLDSPEASAWAQAQSAATLRDLGDPRGSQLFQRLLQTESTDVDQDPLRKLPQVTKIGGLFYDFWSDALYPHGVWRRTTLEEYLKPEPAWEVLLSLDELGAAEGTTWVWKGYSVLEGGTRAMLQLSRGGADAFVAREFDLETKSFVPPDDGGFELPEAKSVLCYRSRDVLLVSTNFGPDSLSSPGYPLSLRAWQRGTPLSSAEVIFEGGATDQIVYAYVVHECQGHSYEVILRGISFQEEVRHVSIDGGRTFTRLDVPGDADVSFFGPFILLRLGAEKLPGTLFAAGSLLAAPAESVLRQKPRWEVVWEPQPDAHPEGTPRFSTLRHMTSTRNYLVLVELVNVRARLLLLKPSSEGWLKVNPDVEGEIASLSARPVDPLESDALWLGRASYTQPPTLYLVRDVGAWASGSGLLPLGGAEATSTVKMLRQLQPLYDACGVETVQLEAVSRDGTRVPYFLTRRRGVSGPTLLYAYGGFAIPVLPNYHGTAGAAWLERGGAYVEANIRGGGEFGPAWSNAARKAGRVKAYEDVEAVADDLHRRGFVRRQLGLLGRSNGGLLVGNMLARSPERFGALVGEVPLLDMRIYHRLLAGPSWVSEYGNPDEAADWAYLQQISPYHLVAQDAKRRPPVLFTTSTRDDRVHPAHARKMVSRLQSAGTGPAYFFESPEGGHSGATSIAERAFLRTLEYEFLWNCLVAS